MDSSFSPPEFKSIVNSGALTVLSGFGASAGEVCCVVVVCCGCGGSDFSELSLMIGDYSRQRIEYKQNSMRTVITRPRAICIDRWANPSERYFLSVICLFSWKLS